MKFIAVVLFTIIGGLLFAGCIIAHREHKDALAVACVVLALFASGLAIHCSQDDDYGCGPNN